MNETNHPARRLRHGDRPDKELKWPKDEPAAANKAEVDELVHALRQAERLLRAAGFCMTGTASSQIIAAIAAHATPPATREVAPQAAQVTAPEDALRVVRRLLDGSQPKDLAGAIMVIDSALNGGAAWTYDIDPPAGFTDYVQANYSGDVTFHDPAWHARRLWNAAMRNFSKSSSGSTRASTSGERQEGGSRG